MRKFFIIFTNFDFLLFNINSMKNLLWKDNCYDRYFANIHLFDEATHSKTDLNHSLRIMKLLFKAVFNIIQNDLII